MGSPNRNVKISETAGPILLKFTEHIGPGMVFWSIKSWLCLNIWRRQTADKIYIFEFSKIRISNNFEDKILKKSSK